MNDKYDEAVEYLTANPGKILGAWAAGYAARYERCPGPSLFQAASRDGTQFGGGEKCVCLTMIRGGHGKAESESLTNAIRSDLRIPNDPSGITAESLPVFAEWQRKIDAELGRPVPA